MFTIFYSIPVRFRPKSKSIVRLVGLKMSQILKMEVSGGLMICSPLKKSLPAGFHVRLRTPKVSNIFRSRIQSIRSIVRVTRHLLCGNELESVVIEKCFTTIITQ